jgi:hypothetical protein
MSFISLFFTKFAAKRRGREEALPIPPIREDVSGAYHLKRI